MFYAGPPFKLDHGNACHTNFANCVRYSSSGQRAVSVSTDKKIQFYDGATGQPIFDIANAHTGGVYSVAFSPDGKRIATASADKTVKIWDVETQALLQTLSLSADPQIADAQVAVLWTPVNLVTVSLNGNINLFNPVDPEPFPARILQDQQVSITSLLLVKDSHALTLLSGSTDGVVCLRNLNALQTQDAVKLRGTDKKHLSNGSHNGKVVGLALTSTGELASVGWDDRLRFADLTSRAYNDEIPLDGQPCAIVSGGGILVVITNVEIALFRGREKVFALAIASLGYTPTCAALLGEEELAVGGSDSKTRMYTVAASPFSLSEVVVLSSPSPISALAFAPGGGILAVGDVGRNVELFKRDGAAWKPFISGQWVYHTSRITCLAWSPSGERLASGSLDENIYLWTVAAPSKQYQIGYTHTGGVSGLDWIDEQKLVSVGNDHCIVTWNLPPPTL